MERKNRRHKCSKCSKWFYWESHGWGTKTEEIHCPHCNATYIINVDEVCEVWLSKKKIMIEVDA